MGRLKTGKMSASGIKHIKDKVEKLITAYNLKSSQLEELKLENESLLTKISSLEGKLNGDSESSRKNELLRKKVESLVKELDDCIELASE
mgnify:CR=1 FL=1